MIMTTKTTIVLYLWDDDDDDCRDDCSRMVERCPFRHPQGATKRRLLPVDDDLSSSSFLYQCQVLKNVYNEGGAMVHM